MTCIWAALRRKVRLKFRLSVSRLVYKGKIVHVAQMVKRVQEAGDHGEVATHSTQVEVELNDPAAMPQMLGREVQVTFNRPFVHCFIGDLDLGRGMVRLGWALSAYGTE
jgi:hypothetical protein